MWVVKLSVFMYVYLCRFSYDRILVRFLKVEFGVPNPNPTQPQPNPAVFCVSGLGATALNLGFPRKGQGGQVLLRQACRHLWCLQRLKTTVFNNAFVTALTHIHPHNLAFLLHLSTYRFLFCRRRRSQMTLRCSTDLFIGRFGHPGRVH